MLEWLGYTALAGSAFIVGLGCTILLVDAKFDEFFEVISLNADIKNSLFLCHWASEECVCYPITDFYKLVSCSRRLKHATNKPPCPNQRATSKSVAFSYPELII